jgi:hypothetical protein
MRMWSAPRSRNDNRPAFALVIALVEPPGEIAPVDPILTMATGRLRPFAENRGRLWRIMKNPHVDDAMGTTATVRSFTVLLGP